MIICVSGNYRSGKSGFSTAISKILGLKHHSMRSITANQKTKYNTDFVDWSKQKLIERNKEIDEQIIEYAKIGNCLLDFRYSALLCYRNRINYIGVWVSSDLKTRVYGNSYCWGKSYEETQKIILTREEQEKKNCLLLHNTDYSLPEYYNCL